MMGYKKPTYISVLYVIRSHELLSRRISLLNVLFDLFDTQ